jgi:hypothetical protein
MATSGPGVDIQGSMFLGTVNSTEVVVGKQRALWVDNTTSPPAVHINNASPVVDTVEPLVITNAAAASKVLTGISAGLAQFASLPATTITAPAFSSQIATTSTIAVAGTPVVFFPVTVSPITLSPGSYMIFGLGTVTTNAPADTIITMVKTGSGTISGRGVGWSIVGGTAGTIVGQDLTTEFNGTGNLWTLSSLTVNTSPVVLNLAANSPTGTGAVTLSGLSFVFLKIS